MGTHDPDLAAYMQEGERCALALANRGPVRFTAEGKLAPDIVEAYLETGFYVFQGVVGEEELAEIRAEFHAILDRQPVSSTSAVDHRGRPALGSDLPRSPFQWSKSLADPLGGTEFGRGRHPVKMLEGKAAGDIPDETVYFVLAPLQYSDAALRLSGHPSLLAICAAINGADFVPFSEAFIVKKPREGAAISWHQDGMTHWSSPDWDPLIHGFTFQVQLYPCRADTAIWYLPGSHRTGKLDIAALVEQAGGNMLPGAVPLICEAGDVALSNRQILHGSFANETPDWRVTMNFGSHRRAAVLGATGLGVDGPQTYDAERIRKRSEVIGYAIDARRQRFPEEAPFVYEPHARSGQHLAWSDAARSELANYNLRDLII